MDFPGYFAEPFLFAGQHALRERDDDALVRGVRGGRVPVADAGPADVPPGRVSAPAPGRPARAAASPRAAADTEFAEAGGTIAAAARAEFPSASATAHACAADAADAAAEHSVTGSAADAATGFPPATVRAADVQPCRSASSPERCAGDPDSADDDADAAAGACAHVLERVGHLEPAAGAVSDALARRGSAYRPSADARCTNCPGAAGAVPHAPSADWAPGDAAAGAAARSHADAGADAGA